MDDVFSGMPPAEDHFLGPLLGDGTWWKQLSRPSETRSKGLYNLVTRPEQEGRLDHWAFRSSLPGHARTKGPAVGHPLLSLASLRTWPELDGIVGKLINSPSGRRRGNKGILHRQPWQTSVMTWLLVGALGCSPFPGDGSTPRHPRTPTIGNGQSRRCG